MSNEKKQGTLLYWEPKGKFGAVVSRNGIQLERYFLHFSQIQICEPETPYEDCVVLFDVDFSRPPKAADKNWCAINAEVYLPGTKMVGGAA
jgi:hypothetical protein